MPETTKPRLPASPASAFFMPTGARGWPPDVWAEAGRGLEAAHCGPAPFGRAVRVAVAATLVVAAKLGVVWVSG